jgi:WD40 repeat protein
MPTASLIAREGRARWMAAAVTVVAAFTGASSAARAQERPDVAWFGGGTAADMLAMSPDGATFVTSNQLSELALKMWRIDGTFVQTLGAERFSPYGTASFSPDGRYLVAGHQGIAGSTDGTAVVFRVSDGALVRSLNPDALHSLNTAFTVAWSPDGATIAVAYNHYGGIELYDAASGALLRTLSQGGYSVAFSPDSRTVVGTTTSGVRLWNVADASVVRTLPTSGSLFSFSGDGRYVAVGKWLFSGESVYVFRTADGGLERAISPSRVESPWRIAFAPDQPLLIVAGSRDAAVPIPELNLFSDEAIQAYRLDGSLAWTFEHEYGIAFSAGFTPDGQTLMIAGGWRTVPPDASYVEGGDDSIQRLRPSDGVELAHFAGVRGGALGVGFSADSRRFVVATSNTTQVWRVADGTIEHTFNSPAGSAVFSSDGTRVVTAEGGPVRIWSVPGYTLERTLDAQAGQAVISVDGTLIGTAGGTTAKLWRVSDGAPLWSRPSNAGGIASVALSPDGQVLAAGCAGSVVRLWSTTDGVLLRSITGNNAVDSIAFSPDGTTIAVGEQAFGNNLKLYRTSDGGLVRSFAGSQGFQTQSLAFTPDGSMIVFSSGAHFIQFWRIADGTLARGYGKEYGSGYFPTMPIAVSPDGRYFGYGRQDHVVVMARNPFGAPACPADFSGDGAVNLQDFLVFLQAYALAEGRADFDANGAVNLNDFLAFLSAFAAGC